MSLTTSLGPAAPHHIPHRRQSPRQRLTATPGWQLVVLFAGYPLWWALGVSQLVFLVAVAFMVVEVARQRRILVPALFGVWLLFLAWTLTGPLVAQVVAPGTVPDIQMSRYFTWAYRLSFFVVATVAVTYVGGLQLSARRVARILSIMFLVVVAGGWLGVLAPHLSFPSLAELLLPHRLTAVPFIYDQVHPTPAEVQDYLGTVNARPSAPFSYANAWGANYAVLLPFFVRGWLVEAGARRRIAGAMVLLSSVVPVIYSLDRGLWAMVIALALFVAGRGFLAGRVWMLASALAAVVVVVCLVVATPLQSKIEARFSGHNSNEARTNLSSLAVVTTASTSPVVGFGATRRMQGSFDSIAQGATPTCPLCTPPALGTQGALWTVIFAYGLGGAVLFMGFFAYQFGRNVARWRSADDAMSLCVLLAFLCTTPIYDFSYPALIAVMSAVALLNLGRQRGGATELTTYRRFLAGSWRSLACLAVAGMAAGAAVEHLSAPSYQATAAVEIPLNHVNPGEVGRLLTLDEVAQMAKSNVVATTVARSVGASTAQVERSLVVSATPNTRILHLTYTGRSAAAARAGASTAARALLAQQRRQLVVLRERELRRLRARSDELAAHASLLTGAPAGPSAALESFLVQDLHAESLAVSTDLVDAETTSTDPGWRISPVSVRRDVDGRMVWMASGAALALTAGLVRALWWAPGRRRLGRAVRRLEPGGIRVLATVDCFGPGGPGEAASLRGVDRVVARQHPAACLALDTFPGSRDLAEVLNARSTLGHTPPADFPVSADASSVVVVASTRTRMGRAAPSLRRLLAASIEIKGLVLVCPHRAGRRHGWPPTVARRGTRARGILRGRVVQ